MRDESDGSELRLARREAARPGEDRRGCCPRHLARFVPERGDTREKRSGVEGSAARFGVSREHQDAVTVSVVAATQPFEVEPHHQFNHEVVALISALNRELERRS